MVVVAFSILLAAAFGQIVGDANTLANRIKVSVVGLLGLGLATKAFSMTRKYLQLAREQTTTRA